MNTQIHADQLEVGMQFRCLGRICTVTKILDSPVPDKVCFRYIKDSGRTSNIRQMIVGKNHAFRIA